MNIRLETMVKLIRNILLSLLVLAGSAEASGELDLKQYKGEVVYLDFWASWCGPCAKSFPWMQAMHEKYSEQGLRIIAVTVDEDPEDAKAFLEKNPADFDIVYDPEGKLAAQYGLIGMPTSLIFDREGLQVSRHLSFRRDHQADYEDELKALLNGGRSK